MKHSKLIILFKPSEFIFRYFLNCSIDIHVESGKIVQIFLFVTNIVQPNVQSLIQKMNIFCQILSGIFCQINIFKYLKGWHINLFTVLLTTIARKSKISLVLLLLSQWFERVTKIKNIKTNSTKILRPTNFLFLNMLLSLT